ncbi:transcription factor bHLH104-like isoform X2 [Tripterygium wilfordii]|uniref:transcription factor bHLH104-like isoform X2 n=1 Tax=Tripterygium wilfordii TaxID=458696 RepID=UPI0018F8616A|nr:transcription factor bHLH104-like isoform X2 [Tripterygium wilfordii]
MEGFEDYSCLDFLACDLINNNSAVDLIWPNHSVDMDFSLRRGLSQEKYCAEEKKDCIRKRGRNETSNKPGTKACREKLRRERLNERFSELSSVLEPGRPAKTDKPTILDDAIRILNQLRTETQELKETNERLLEEIKNLKAEKNELREEKLVLKADKERMEQQLKTIAIPSAGFVPSHPAAYHAGGNKMAVFQSYNVVPMWQYLPPSTHDTSQDHKLRSPAA